MMRYEELYHLFISYSAIQKGLIVDMLMCFDLMYYMSGQHTLLTDWTSSVIYTYLRTTTTYLLGRV